VRRLTGGRAPDYEARRKQRKATKAYASRWTGAAASVALAALDAVCGGKGRARQLVLTLTNDSEWAQYESRLTTLGPSEVVPVIRDTLHSHTVGMRHAGVTATSATAKRWGDDALKPLLQAAAPSRRVGTLDLKLDGWTATTFREWLSEDASDDTHTTQSLCRGW